jgi:hypothetical protein
LFPFAQGNALADSDGSGVSARPAITPENILDKLCFLRFGGGTRDHKEEFKKDLYSFRRRKAAKDVTRETVRDWFEHRKSVPHNAAAGNRDERPTAVLSLSHHRRVMIDIPQGWDVLRDLSQQIIGTYQLLHMTLEDSANKPVASEFLEIFPRGRELRFRLIHPVGDREKATTEGLVMRVGNTLWLIGSSNSFTPRLRILALRHIETEEKRYNELRWGIMTTDIPKPSSPDPIACRCVLLKENEEVHDVDLYIEKVVRHVGKEETEKEPLKSIMRLLLNNVTALSDGHSPNPALKEGNPIVDEPLKVNQATAELVADRLAHIS